MQSKELESGKEQHSFAVGNTGADTNSKAPSVSSSKKIVLAIVATGFVVLCIVGCIFGSSVYNNKQRFAAQLYYEELKNSTLGKRQSSFANQSIMGIGKETSDQLSSSTALSNTNYFRVLLVVEDNVNDSHFNFVFEKFWNVPVTMVTETGRRTIRMPFDAINWILEVTVIKFGSLNLAFNRSESFDMLILAIGNLAIKMDDLKNLWELFKETTFDYYYMYHYGGFPENVERLFNQIPETRSDARLSPLRGFDLFFILTDIDNLCIVNLSRVIAQTGTHVQ